MWTNSYFDNQVLLAEPLELVRILYRAAIDSVQQARTNLAQGDIMARSNAIGRAQAIIGELEASLDHTAGGEISRNLAELYVYMRHRLTAANIHQQGGPLAEVEILLGTMYDAWQQVGPPPEEAPVGMASAPVWNSVAPETLHPWSA